MTMLIGRINNHLQLQMQANGLKEISLATAISWIRQHATLNKFSPNPETALRRYVQQGNIFGAFQKNNYFWFIRYIPNYVEILSVADLSEIFGLRCRTSLYRKIKYHQIPYIRHHHRGIYFLKSDLFRWSVERSNPHFYNQVQQWLLKQRDIQ